MKKTGTGLKLEREEASEYGKRGAAKRKANLTFNVEGDYVTTADMVRITGANLSTVQKRLKSAIRSDGGVTWAKLRGEKK